MSPAQCPGPYTGDASFRAIECDECQMEFISSGSGLGLYRRQGAAITNCQGTFPKPQSDLAQQLIRDPYNSDFLTLAT